MPNARLTPNDLLSPSSDGATVDLLGHRCAVSWTDNQRTVYYEDGGIMSRGSFLGRKPVGLHEDWHPNGSISAIEMYSEDGRADGPFEYYDESGNPQRKGSYVDGVKHGHWLEYWAGGRIRSEGVLEAGDRQGHWTYHDSISGSVDLRRSGEYVDDERVGD